MDLNHKPVTSKLIVEQKKKVNSKIKFQSTSETLSKETNIKKIKWNNRAYIYPTKTTEGKILILKNTKVNIQTERTKQKTHIFEPLYKKIKKSGWNKKV